MPDKKVKKILIFSLAYYPHVGGAEIALKEITDRMTDIEFHMVTMHFSAADAREEKIGNVFVHRIGNGSRRLNKFLFQFSAARKASQLHRLYHFDGIWAMMAHSCGIPAGIFKTLHPEVKYLLTLQEGDPLEHIERLARPVWPLFKRGFTKADSVVAESTFLGRWARRMGFRGPLEVVPNGVNFVHFSQEFRTEDIQRAQETLGKKPQNVFLVTTSRLVKKNAIDDVIRALPLLPANVYFLVYGIGPEEHSLRTLANNLKVADRVRFNGYLLHKDMPLVLKSCDIYVRPSRSEGMGNVFIEAMAAELPVIATQEGGIADFLYDAKRNTDKETTGWAVDKDSPGQIAEAVKDILAHPEQVAQVKATAKQMVFEKYDWELIARQMQAVFKKLIDDERTKHILKITDQFIERYRGALEKLAKH